MAYGLLYGMASRDIVLCFFLVAFYSSFGKSQTIFLFQKAQVPSDHPSLILLQRMKESDRERAGKKFELAGIRSESYKFLIPTK